MTFPKVLVINGANLNLLGVREPDIYGLETLADLEAFMKKRATELSLSIDFFQSNSEGDIVDAIHASMGCTDLLIINAGAYSHYSIAIRDAIACAACPAIEVHISNIYAREEFRRFSCLSGVCCGTISGFGFYGYIMALEAGGDMLRESSP